MRVKKTTQYVVMASSRPGPLARLAGTIADAGVDLAAVVMTRAGESLQLKFVAKARRGLKAKLENKGVRVIESPVLIVEGDSPFALLDQAARAFAEQGIDVLSCYPCFDSGRASWVLSVNKLEAAAAALQASSAVPA